MHTFNGIDGRIRIDGLVSESFKQFLVENNIEIKKETVTDHDVVVFKFPQEALQMPDASTFLSILREQIETTFGCPAIGFVNGIDILVENADQAVDMLNGMIAKVKVRSAVGNAGKIILPN
jgi:hypothetical protein